MVRAHGGGAPADLKSIPNQSDAEDGTPQQESIGAYGPCNGNGPMTQRSHLGERNGSRTLNFPYHENFLMFIYWKIEFVAMEGSGAPRELKSELHPYI